LKPLDPSAISLRNAKQPSDGSNGCSANTIYGSLMFHWLPNRLAELRNPRCYEGTERRKASIKIRQNKLEASWAVDRLTFVQGYHVPGVFILLISHQGYGARNALHIMHVTSWGLGRDYSPYRRSDSHCEGSMSQSPQKVTKGQSLLPNLSYIEKLR
jgi:hypothetical protein